MGDVVKFKTEETTSTEALADSLKDLDPEVAVVLCRKDGEIYLTYTNFDSRLELLGALSGLQTWLWNELD
jgi:hypothetical protein